MGRRVLAFFLGFLIGIVFVFGAVGAAIYITATVVHPSDIYPDSNKFLGDLADMSLYDIYRSITDLYKEKAGVTEDGLYFTLGQFCEHYNINASELFGGKEVPQDVLEIPIFELLSENSDAAMQQVKVSALFSLVNLFSSDETGEGLFSQEMIVKLRAYNMAELTDSEKGFSYVFQDVLLSDVLPGIFPPDRFDDNAIMWAFGQSSIGKLFGGMNGNLLLQFKPEGAFEAMGSLKMKELLGDDSAMLNAIFRNYTLADFIDDNGSVNPDDILDGVYLGDLLGYQRNQLKERDTQEFSEKYVSENGNKAVLSKGEGEDEEFIIRLSPVGDGDYEYFQARMTCTIAEHEHSEECGEADEDGKYQCGTTNHEHNANCFGFIWYMTEAATEVADDDMIKDGVHYNRASGLYTAIADVTIGDLTNGNADALIDRLMDVKLHEILEGQDTSGIVDNLKDMTLRELLNDGIEQIYLGTFFGYVREEVPDDGFSELNGLTDVKINDAGVIIRKDGDKWYIAESTCEEDEHTHEDECYEDGELTCGKKVHHTAACYKFVWYMDADCTVPSTGIKAALSSTTVGGLHNINDTILDLTLNEVLGSENMPSMLKGLGSTKIRNLEAAINGMYLGDFLEYVRKPLSDVEGESTPLKNEDGDVIYYLIIDAHGNIALSADETNWYEGTLICTDDDPEHEHDCDCYGFTWYTCNDESENHVHGSGNNCSLVEGMMGKLANETIANLNGLNETVMSFTLRDVMGEDVPDMLKSIQDTQIKNLNDAIDQMYLGDFLEYIRKPVDGVDEYDEEFKDANGKTLYYLANTGDGVAMSVDGKVWYEGELICLTSDDTDHVHNADCYGFVWYKCKESEKGHTHDENCYTAPVEGMMGKLANEKVNELGDLNETIMSFTLRDVMGEDVPSMLKSVQDTPIRDLSEAIDEMYLGEFLEYKREIPENIDEFVRLDADTDIKLYFDSEANETLYAKLDEDGNWYLAKLDCTNKAHTSLTDHDASCFDYVWYELKSANSDEYKEVTGVMGRLASVPIGELSSDTLREKVNNTTLGEVLGDLSNNAILNELSDVRIGDLSKELNELYVGTAMGYHREEATGDFIPDNKNDTIIQNGDKYYKLDEHKNKYYNAQLNCRQKHAHGNDCYGYVWYDCEHNNENAHDEACIVKGLNSKMSNLTLKGLADNQLNAILEGLTIGDLIDSGMMNAIEGDNVYKLAIIFCGEDHSFSETVREAITGKEYQVQYECTLAGYFSYLASNPDDKTAENFWERAHDDSFEDDQDAMNDHLFAWKDMPLKEFMSQLLSSI